MEEDEGIKWDGILREESAATGQNRNGSTLMVHRDHPDENTRTTNTPQNNQETALATDATMGQEPRRDQPERNPNDQDNNNPPYTTYDQSMLTPIPQGGYPEVHG